MYDSSTPSAEGDSAPPSWPRLAVLERRRRFAALLSQLSGWSMARAWGVFTPLPGSDSAGMAAQTGPAPREAR